MACFAVLAFDGYEVDGLSSGEDGRLHRVCPDRLVNFVATVLER